MYPVFFSHLTVCVQSATAQSLSLRIVMFLKLPLSNSSSFSSPPPRPAEWYIHTLICTVVLKEWWLKCFLNAKNNQMTTLFCLKFGVESSPAGFFLVFLQYCGRGDNLCERLVCRLGNLEAGRDATIQLEIRLNPAVLLQAPVKYALCNTEYNTFTAILLSV